MNIFYEESGQFKVAAIVQKRRHLPSRYPTRQAHQSEGEQRLCRVRRRYGGVFENAQAQAADIDTDLLWEVCGEEEFSAEAIAEEYYGHAPTKTELAATLIALYAAPMYFYKSQRRVQSRT